MPDTRAERAKEILSYIHEHYNEKITANDIAKRVNISRGECFRCFKQFMNKGLVEYINEYRLQRAAELLKKTEMNVTDISAQCGFDNSSYFGKIFKQAYSMTPFQYRKARILTENAILNINGYDYEFWKDCGNGTMTITRDDGNGSLLCRWSNANDIVFRSGKKFFRNKTHKQIGSISLEYDAVCNCDGNSYLCVYGWTTEPLAEWYIVENYTAFKPSGGVTRLGTLESDGGVYEIYRFVRENRPSILGTATFDQYWSIRKPERSGGIVDVSAHFYAWESLGLTMGNLAEVSLAVEGYKSNGNAAVRTNVLTIGGRL